MDFPFDVRPAESDLVRSICHSERPGTDIAFSVISQLTPVVLWFLVGPEKVHERQLLVGETSPGAEQASLKEIEGDRGPSENQWWSQKGPVIGHGGRGGEKQDE